MDGTNVLKVKPHFPDFFRFPFFFAFFRIFICTTLCSALASKNGSE